MKSGSEVVTKMAMTMIAHHYGHSVLATSRERILLSSIIRILRQKSLFEIVISMDVFVLERTIAQFNGCIIENC